MTETMDLPVLPAEFGDLEPFSDWALWGERARYDKRYDSTMAELQAFYDAAFPRVDDALGYLEQFPYDDSMPDVAPSGCCGCSAAGHGVVPGRGVAPTPRARQRRRQHRRHPRTRHLTVRVCVV